jgi:hypothetical protein
MHLLLSFVVHTANVLGSFNDPFEFQGDYGSEMNPVREKVFELIVAKEALSDESQAIEQDKQHGPTFNELVSDHLIEALTDKQQEIGISSDDLNRIVQFTKHYGDQKPFYFLRHNPQDLLSMDKILRNNASRKGIPFDLQILSSTAPLKGQNGEELKKNLLDQLFTKENLQLSKPLPSLPKVELKKYLGESADNKDLEAFTTPAGQLFFYWLYQALNLHLISQEPDLIPQINKVKQLFAATLGDPQVRADTFREKLIKADTSVLFTQESDTFVPKALLKEQLFLPATSQNTLDGTLVFLKSSDWETPYEIVPVSGYEGYAKGRINLILAKHKPTGQKFLLGAAHGNSTNPEDGRLQIQLIKEQFDRLAQKPENQGLQLLIGIDANTKSEKDVEDLHKHLDSLGLVGTSVGPTTIKQRMVTAQNSKSGRFAVDEEDFLITLKRDHGGAYALTHPTVGFKEQKADTSKPLPNLENLSDHYPVGATLEP